MKVVSVIVFASTLIISGCAASVEMASKQESAKAKEFNKPSQNKAGLYVYRNSFYGKGLTKDVWVDGECLGETANDVFFYTEVEDGMDGKRHLIKAAGDAFKGYPPGVLQLRMETGKNYFVRLLIEWNINYENSVIISPHLEQVTEEQGKKDISSLEMAKSGMCRANLQPWYPKKGFIYQ